MKKFFVLISLLPVIACTQEQDKMHVQLGTINIGFTGSMKGQGVETGLVYANNKNNWAGQVRLTALVPSVNTGEKLIPSGEDWIRYKAPALVSIGIDLLYMPRDYSGYIARTYGIAGFSYGPVYENAFAQIGAGIDSKHINIAVTYRLGFAHYAAAGGWHLHLVKNFQFSH